MEEQSFIRFQQFPDEGLLERCVNDAKGQLNECSETADMKVCRCVGFFSDETEGNNQLSRTNPMTTSLIEMLTLVNKIYNSNFNGILVNRYKDGRDYMSARSYNANECDVKGVVSISYGATRKCRIRSKTDTKNKNDFKLISKSMLQMGGRFQEEFTHEIPVEKKVKKERISFTFLKLLT